MRCHFAMVVGFEDTKIDQFNAAITTPRILEKNEPSCSPSLMDILRFPKPCQPAR
jgi:hypothetical protein